MPWAVWAAAVKVQQAWPCPLNLGRWGGVGVGGNGQSAGSQSVGGVEREAKGVSNFGELAGAHTHTQNEQPCLDHSCQSPPNSAAGPGPRSARSATTNDIHF